MKKISLYIFLVLMVCNVGFAECIKGNCINGYGTYTFESGSKYVGEFKDGNWHGQGTFTGGGGKYVGQWKNNDYHGQGIMTYADGSQYVGEFKNSKKNGQGTHTSANGDKYVGEYKDDKRQGQGTFTGTDGGNYVGGFKNGRKYGQGTLTYANGTIDKGIWQDGKLKWQLDFDRAKVLNGVWTINQPMDSFLNESESGHNFVDEEIYIYKHRVGFVNADYVCQIVSTEHPFIISRNSKKFGVKENSYVVLRTNCKNNEEKFGFDNIFIANKGSLVFFQYSTHFFFGPPWWTFSIDMIPEGQPNQFHNSFERDEVKFVTINKVGDMDEKKFFGKFKHKFKDLNQAENTLPECKGTERHKWTNCKGIYTFESGSKYVGQYKDGKRNGQGTYTYADGGKYIGEWKDGERHGQGTLTWASGDKYVGEYKDDEQHGQGTYIWADGGKYVGEFKDGKRNGQGTWTHPSGDKYVGEFKDGKGHGQGTYTHANGDKYVGEFKDDEQHGQGTFTTADGTVEKGIWEKGKLIKRQENMVLECKEIGKDKTYTYSIDDEFISFGLYKYTIKDINEIKIRAERDNLENEYGFVIVDRVKGTIEHVHGLGGKSESVMKANVIFALNLECEKVESKF